MDANVSAYRMRHAQARPDSDAPLKLKMTPPPNFLFLSKFRDNKPVVPIDCHEDPDVGVGPAAPPPFSDGRGKKKKKAIPDAFLQLEDNMSAAGNLCARFGFILRCPVTVCVCDVMEGCLHDCLS